MLICVQKRKSVTQTPNKEAAIMTRNISYQDYYDSYEYHGSTTVVVTRRQGRHTIWKDWIVFDTVEEASEYFNDHCEN
jgi:hypothetical protein